MQEQEETSPSLSSLSNLDYLKDCQLKKDDHVSSRSKMCHWSFQLADITALSRLSVSRSMTYLDRYVAAHSDSESLIHDKRTYQLASMTCLYIAIKLYEPLRLDASLLAEISAGCYTTKEILDMETSILKALEWRMNALPTAQEYVSLILGLLNPQGYGYDLEILGSLLDVASYQCELATADYELCVNGKASVVGLASVCNALEGIMDDDILSSTAKYAFMNRVCGLGIDRKEVRLVQFRLRELFCQEHSSKDNGVDQIPQQQQQSQSKESVVENRTSSNSDVKKEIDMKKDVSSMKSSKCPSPISIVAVPTNHDSECDNKVLFAKCA
jgi:hypothetical protein